MNNLIGTRDENEGNEWLSVADLMAGLMVIFLFVAIVFIRPLQEKNDVLRAQTEELETQTEALETQTRELEDTRDRIADIARTWKNTEEEIYTALVEEFGDDLPRWNAEIDKPTLIVRFKSPDILFLRGKADLRERFASILSDFFPRYINVLQHFRSSLEELRIEGHTSSDWNIGVDTEVAYFRNMALSQARTRTVLRHVLTLPQIKTQAHWVRPLATANGLSSSHLIYDADRKEDREASRRVEFRVRTTAREEIVRILGEVQ